jgi:hypothetical protein
MLNGSHFAPDLAENSNKLRTILQNFSRELFVALFQPYRYKLANILALEKGYCLVPKGKV